MPGELIAFILAGGLICAVLLFYRYACYVFDLKARPMFPAAWLLFIAIILFVLARYLPTPQTVIHNQTFVQHMVGGGVVCSLIYSFLYIQFGRRLPPLLQLVGLFMVVSSLGVLNELLEFFVTQTHLFIINGADTWWDLAANTLGAIFGFLLLVPVVGKMTKR